MKRKHTMTSDDDVVYCTTQHDIMKCLNDDIPFMIFELNNLSINGVRIGLRQLKLLSDALKANRTITELDIWSNNICVDGSKAIAESLKANRTITELNIRSTNIGVDGSKAIADALKVNRTITKLDISNNNIGDEGAKAIAEALKVNRTLTILSISLNYIGNEGAKAIAEALKVNRTITKIDLRYTSYYNIGGTCTRFWAGGNKQCKYAEQQRLEFIRNIKEKKMLILLEYYAGEHSLFHMLPLEMIYMILNYVVVPRPIEIVCQ